MHNSVGGAPATAAFPLYQTGPFLLKASDQSSTCLNCHGAANDTAPSSYHIYDNDTYGLNDGKAPANITPGGDFAWVKKSYQWSPRSGTTENSEADRHGHNIVAADYGFNADATLTTAPGGSYPAANLACSSCHDPHGKYRRDDTGTISATGKPIIGSGSYATSSDPTTWGSVGVYRILGGVDYSPKSMGGANAFVNGPPAAVAPSSYNRTEATTQTRVAYGSGMSEWCQNCHSSIHRDSYTSGTSSLSHPAGNNAKLTAAIITNYNSYVKTGDLTGTAASAYNSLVPFEEGSADYTTLKSHALNTGAAAAMGGADANSNVACISCHRVHASGFDSMVRFDSTGYEFMTVDDGAGNPVYGDPAAAVSTPASIFTMYLRPYFSARLCG
jgi:cytochrome c551/c552